MMTKKRPLILLTALGLCLGLLTGCKESAPLLTAEDYTLDTENNKTNRSVTLGDTSDTFLAAYGEYKIFTSVDGSDYQMLAHEEIPFDSVVTTLLPTFFIDGLPIDPDAFCNENELEKSDLLNLLSSEDYLASHRVEYYYLIFTWENGVITDIRSEYMDYNEDGANWLLYNVA